MLQSSFGISCVGAGACSKVTALVAFLAGGIQDPSAGRAGGVGGEPLVDARQVEGVAAVRKHSDLVTCGKFGKADDAVVIRKIGSGLRREGELRERAEDLLIQSLVGLGRRKGGPDSVGGRRGEAAEPGAAGDGYETEDAYQSAEDGGKYEDEVRVNGNRFRSVGYGGIIGRRGCGPEEAEGTRHVRSGDGKELSGFGSRERLRFGNMCIVYCGVVMNQLVT